ncbi:MAG: response regulator [Deltaproteobacteria bacterium]|nr:response regulator [Deltaproteobacteria bacterium]
MGARVLVIDDSPTLRKVVGHILARYDYEAVVAVDGQAGLDMLSTEKVDLILLDFVMPRMNGYQFCRELRAMAEHKTLPVVLMSAKAERIRDQFLQQTGAVDAITKPFDSRGLIAVVEGALQKAQAGRVPPAPEPSAMADESDLSKPPDSMRPSSRMDEASRNARARSEVVQMLTSVVAAAFKSAPPDEAVKESTISESIASLVDDAAMHDLSARLSAWRQGRGSQEALSGDISSIPLGEILQVLQMQRQTGVLEVTNGKVEISIILRDGFIDLAQAKGATQEFRLGRYFIESGLLAREQLENAVHQASESKQLLGSTLKQMGLVTDEDLRRALIRQTSEMIYDVLRWQRGRFMLLRDVQVPEADDARLGLPVAGIVMEGFRRVDEWRLIEESIRFDEVLVRNEPAIATLGPDELTKQERTVLDTVDGHRTVREIIDETHQSSFDTCKTFYRLLQSRLVRRRATA